MTAIGHDQDTSRRTAPGLVEIDGVEHYAVDHVERMAPFLMSVVSDGDRWMFVSSSGALTAGRRDASQSLFPYVTDDRLHGAGGATGPVTVLRVAGDHGGTRWEPFAPRPTPGTTRSISKTVLSESVLFTERLDDAGLTFESRWSSAERWGFVRSVSLTNEGPTPVTVDVLDGLVDVLPYGLEPIVYQRLSNLTNAYKRSEVVDPDTALAVFTLEAPVSDTAEPEEVLRATTVWSTGFDGVLDLRHDALDEFRDGRDGTAGHLVVGVPGAYLRRGRLDIAPGASATWHVVADVGRDQLDVTELRDRLAVTPPADIVADLERSVERTRLRLTEIMSPADAEQCTGDPVACAHHASNVVYNVMRGGVPLDGYRIETADFADFVATRNRTVAARRRDWLDALPAELERAELLEMARTSGDVHLRRLADEYLPFSFSRRHGDPSRPWNQFSIRVTDAAGAPLRYFEGNWRDVFQNWEALCASFPEYLPGIVSMFVNASTADGHNPYRITRDGIDWEVPDPDDPWANIGYWGDHQIVYLLRLLDATEAHSPGLIARRLVDRVHTYADVPYRIAPYEELLRDPKSTITFDAAADARSAERVARLGGDGKLVLDDAGEPVVVTLLEKLVVTTLARLSNFVPGGGIWLNTQRPEWNDANNALVGHGLSMVTLFHLRRFVERVGSLVAARDPDASEHVAVSVEVATWLAEVVSALDTGVVGGGGDDATATARRALLDRLGTSASDHRARLGAGGLSGATTDVRLADVVLLCERAMTHLDGTVAASRRADGLVHAYNLIEFPDEGRALVRHLPEMLEGQVAALTPGLFTAAEQADLLDALFNSELHRDDLDTFLLAPPRRPPAFLDKNVVPADAVDADPLLAALVADREASVLAVGVDGTIRFDADLTTADALLDRLDDLARDPRWHDLVERHRDTLVATYESVFGHHAHLGRSGTMYAYEGIGSTYWHMVTKLLLAVQEAVSHAASVDPDGPAVDRLVAAYWRVRGGLGVNMSPEVFGAVPIDPYSHTPAHAGAQQPGMTGAVKEEILARPRELGVRVEGGRLVFDALLLRAEDEVATATTWRRQGAGEPAASAAVELPAGSRGFTCCAVPVVVRATDGPPRVEVTYADGRVEQHDGDRVPAEASAAIFERRNTVSLVRADVRRPSPGASG